MTKGKSFRLQSILTLISVLSIGAIAATMIANSNDNIVPAWGKEKEYNLNFNSSTNTFTPSSVEVTATALTELGNAVSFAHKGYASDASNWGRLEAGGYFFNTSPISGLTSITFAFGASSGDLSLSYGWAETEGAIVYEANGIIINSTNPTFAFDGYRPSFLKIANGTSGSIQVSSIDLCFTCAATNDVILGAGSLTFELNSDGLSYKVTKCTTSGTAVSVPASYNDKPVTVIGQNSFGLCGTITSIAIPSSVTTIESWAFSDCGSLTSLTLADSITSIGDYAFYSDTSLTAVILPSSLSSFGPNAFAGCTGISAFSLAAGNTTYAVSDGVLFSIDGTRLVRAPDGKSGSYTIPDGVTALDESAFSGCESLSAIAFPSGLETVGAYAFANCTGIASISLPDSVTSIGTGAFSYDSALTSATLSSGLMWIESSAFASSGLTSIAIPASVQSIGLSAFENCFSLSEVTIPTDSLLNTISDCAFQNCTALVSFSVPSHVSSISSPRVFRGCQNLNNIYVDGGNTFYFSSPEGILFAANAPTYGQNELFCCPENQSGLLEIPSSVNVNGAVFDVSFIGDYSFGSCSQLTNISVPSSIIGIGLNAFDGCSGLSTFSFADPSTLLTIGGGAFSSCGSLSYLPSFTGLTSIGSYAFVGCSSLTTFFIPSTVVELGYAAFYYCTSMSIRCGSTAQPGTWDAQWNIDYLPVTWGETA